MRWLTIIAAMLLAGCGLFETSTDECGNSCAANEVCYEGECRELADYGTSVDSDIPYDRLRTEHPTTGESWTVMIYASADNDLEPAIADDLRELMRVDTNDKLNIVVQADFSDEYGEEIDLLGVPRWTTAKRFHVADGTLVEKADLREIDSSTPRTLAEFMIWGAEEYPADRYAIILLSHGFGWKNFGRDDSNGGSSFTLATLTEAFDYALRASEPLDEFSLIGIDACISATAEVAIALSPFGEYLLASQDNEPGHGWNYEALKLLESTPQTAPIPLAAHLAEKFVEYGQANGKTALTQSLIDLYEMRTFQEELDTFGLRLTGDPAKYEAVTFQASQARYFPNQDPAPTYLYDLKNLIDLLEAYDSSSFATPVQPLRAAFDNAVVFSVTGDAVSRANGMNIYLPPDTSAYDEAYGQVPAVQGWRDFLRGLHTWRAGLEPATIAPDSVSVTRQSDALVVTAQLADGEPTSTTASVVFVDGSQRPLVRVPAIVAGDGSIRATWNERAIEAGGEPLFASAGAEGETFEAPVVYDEPGDEPVAAVVRYYISQGRVATVGFYHAGPTNFSELTPSMGTFHPYDGQPGSVSSAAAGPSLTAAALTGAQLVTGSAELARIEIDGGGSVDVIVP